MCTAITFRARDRYFARTLDHDDSFGEEAVITPRRAPLRFRNASPAARYAILGTGLVQKDFPLYFDAVNERGLCIAGLNFGHDALYETPKAGMPAAAQFELIPLLLSQCATLREASALLHALRVTDEPFSPDLPAAKLHWLLADGEGAVVLEYTREGMRLYDNPAGVLTNGPPFPVMLGLLRMHRALSPCETLNTLCPALDLAPVGKGTGSEGLPGALTSPARFVRAAFHLLNAEQGGSDEACIVQGFHVLETVSQPRGSCRTAYGYETTQYTVCYNATQGAAYYTTYCDRTVRAFSLRREDLDGTALLRYPLSRRFSPVFDQIK